MIDAVLALDDVFRREHGLVLASLVGTFRDLDLAEDSLADAIAVAAETWPQGGVPDNPAAWLITVARRKAIDRIRRARSLEERLPLLVPAQMEELESVGTDLIEDERLRLIFACCHPALSLESRVPLTLKSLCGLSTAEIARAFLTSESAMFQRITRAKSKIRLARIPLEMPSQEDIPDRVDGVIAVIYLIFNEGYQPLRGEALSRPDLCREAIQLAEMMCRLVPDASEVMGLAALCWLTDARREARVDPDGRMVLLEDQDRGRWDPRAIARGVEHLDRARHLAGMGPYLLQAEIAATHARAQTWSDTDWGLIISLYEKLLKIKPSPVVALNLAAAVAMAEGPQVGLDLMAELEVALEGYQPFHVARAELALRAGLYQVAAGWFEQALGLPGNDVEREHLTRRLVRSRGLADPK